MGAWEDTSSVSSGFINGNVAADNLLDEDLDNVSIDNRVDPT